METTGNLTPITSGTARYFKRLSWSIKKRLIANVR